MDWNQDIVLSKGIKHEHNINYDYVKKHAELIPPRPFNIWWALATPKYIDMIHFIFLAIWNLIKTNVQMQGIVF